MNRSDLKEYAFLTITHKCNLNCRHCCVNKNLVQQINAERDNILEWIRQIALSQDKAGVSFVGGEPFLCLDDLVEYVKCATENNLQSSVITNGYWAKTAEAAEKVLDRLPGLGFVIVSSDKYHLEFVDEKTVCNVIDACLKRNIVVQVNVVAADREEGIEGKRIYSEKYGERIFVSVAQMFKPDPPPDFAIEEFNFAKQTHLLRNKCEISSHLISISGDVYTCCNGARLGNGEGLLFLGNMEHEPYKEMLRKRDNSVIYRFMHKYGPAGLAKVISMSPLKDEFNKKTFSHQCDMCIWALENEHFCRYFIPRARRQFSL